MHRSFQQPRKRARREAERMFRKLAVRDASGDSVAQIIFPERFSVGKCVIGMLIPVHNRKSEFMMRLAGAHEWCHYAPILMNSRKKCCLRLAYRFSKIHARHRKKLLWTVSELARWAKEKLGFDVYVESVPGLVAARRKLRIF